MKKIDQIKKNVFLKEFNEKLKRKKVGRRNQIIHVIGTEGKSPKPNLTGKSPQLGESNSKELEADKTGPTQEEIRANLAKELKEMMETANVNDDKNSESSSSELTDQASSHISDITNSEKRWEAIEKKVKQNEKAYKLKVKQMEKKNPNIRQDSKNNLTAVLG